MVGLTLATTNAGAVEVDLDGHGHGAGRERPAECWTTFRWIRNRSSTVIATEAAAEGH